MAKITSHACGFVVTKSQTALLTFTAVLQPDVSIATAPSVPYSLQLPVYHTHHNSQSFMG